MKTFEERFTAWVDGKLDGRELAEFETELQSHPGAQGNKQEARRLGEFLRAYPAPPLSNPDFFNHQLFQRIAAETPRPPRPKAKPAFPSPLWRLISAGCFLLIAAGLLFKVLIPVGTPKDPASPYFAQVVEAWPATANVSATTVYRPEDNLTVVWLEGLEFIPASQQIQ